MEHHELVQEMTSIERMTTQDRLKHAKKRRSQQLKKWTQYDKQLEKDNSKKSKKKGTPPPQAASFPRPRTERVKFVPSIALLEAAARNDLEEVRRLLSNKVSPDVTNEDGLTALHQCCIDNNEELLMLLLEFGANVNACDSEMWTPLHAAATCGHVTLCKHLIEKGAELLSVNSDGNMPYDICEDETTLDYIESEMAKRGITQEQIDETRLSNERQMLRDLKEVAANKGDLEVRDSQGASLLHIASANGYIEVTEFLLNQRVKIDTQDNESWQPVHAAAYWGQLEILEMLVQHGADLDSKTKSGETPFDLSEDPDIRQRILDIKDELEVKLAASRLRPGSSRKLKHNSRNSSIRRSSLRGDKGSLFKKEAHEEALHFGMGRMPDEEEMGAFDEEKENLAVGSETATMDGHAGASSYVSKLPNLPPPRVSTASKSNSDVDEQLTDDSFPGSAGSTLSDLKRRRSDQRRDSHKDSLDAQFQQIFLESVPRLNNRTSTGSIRSNQAPQTHFFRPPMMEKTNGHNSNNNSVVEPAPARPASSAAPSGVRTNQEKAEAPADAGVKKENKKGCCVVS